MMMTVARERKKDKREKRKNYRAFADVAAGAEDGIMSLLLQVGDVEEEGGVAERGGEAIVVEPFCVCLW